MAAGPSAMEEDDPVSSVFSELTALRKLTSSGHVSWIGNHEAYSKYAKTIR